MDGDLSLRPILRRLDADLAEAFEGRERVVVAFSGGLASLVLAALARKRGPVTCVVVGTARAADLEAALVAKSFLDYRMEELRPSGTRILRAARMLRAGDPHLDLKDILSLLPLALVRERHPDEIVLSGFGVSPRSAALARYLSTSGMETPGLRTRPAAAIPRRSLLGLASVLAIPDAFARGPRRSPAEGSGIGPALRAMGHARHASVDRLLRDLV